MQISLGDIWKGIATVIGGLTAIVTLVFLIFPNLARWTTYRVDVTETSIEHNAVMKEFSKRAYMVPKQAKETKDRVVHVKPPYKPERVGNIVSFRLEMEGTVRREIRMFWSVYEDSGQRVKDVDLNDQPGWPSNGFQGNRILNVVSGDAFVPLPKKDGIYFVEITAWDTTGLRMDVEDSPRFEVVGDRSKEVPADSHTSE